MAFQAKEIPMKKVVKFLLVALKNGLSRPQVGLPKAAGGNRYGIIKGTETDSNLFI